MPASGPARAIARLTSAGTSGSAAQRWLEVRWPRGTPPHAPRNRNPLERAQRDARWCGIDSWPSVVRPIPMPGRMERLEEGHASVSLAPRNFTNPPGLTAPRAPRSGAGIPFARMPGCSRPPSARGARPADDRHCRRPFQVSFLSRLERFDVVTSTNDVVAGWLAEGTPEVALAIADRQTAGRGREQRTWIAPPGAALLLSLGFRPSGMPLADGG